jgi:predicted PurR-regulated permease PerM
MIGGVGDRVPGSDSRRSRLWAAAGSRGIPLGTILTSVAAVAAAYLAGKLIYRLRELVLVFFVAGFVALILNPLVVALQNWRIRRRGCAVSVVTLFSLLVFVGLAALFGYPLVNGLTHLAHALPSYVNDAERGSGPIGHIVQKYHIQRWITTNEPKLVKLGQDLAKPALSFGEGAFSLLFSLFLIFVLVLLLLLEGPKMRASLLRLMPSDRAERYGRVAGEMNRAVGGYMLGDIATSLIAGIVVLLTLLLLGVPFAYLWALWVALVDFLPMIGGALAGIPVVLFAAAHSLTAGIVTLLVFVIYTQIENHVLNPIVMSRTVKINPLMVLVSILIGAYIGSWIGGAFGAFVAALLAIPAAGAIQVLVREMWLATASGPVVGPPDNEPPETERAKRLGAVALVPADRQDRRSRRCACHGECRHQRPDRSCQCCACVLLHQRCWNYGHQRCWNYGTGLEGKSRGNPVMSHGPRGPDKLLIRPTRVATPVLVTAGTSDRRYMRRRSGTQGVTQRHQHQT